MIVLVKFTKAYPLLLLPSGYELYAGQILLEQASKIVIAKNTPSNSIATFFICN
jgi:hypothetical protein